MTTIAIEPPSGTMSMASNRTTLSIPRGMAAQDVAEVLNGYLRGSASRNIEKHGPYKQESKWQLDGSNNYWMSEVDEQSVEVRCRYDGQQDVIDAMAALFTARFLYVPSGERRPSAMA